MDTITHTLVGTTLAQTRLGRVSPVAPIALALAANFPDFENIVLGFCDKPTNMIHHRSVTHALLGLVVLIPLWTTIVYAGARWWAKQRGNDPPAWRPLLLGITLAIGSHPVLDWLNTYGVRPWLPFDGTWYHGDLVFIVDPYLWLLLIAGTALAGQRTRFGSIALVILTVVFTGVIALASPLGPPALLVIWLVGIATILVGRLRGWGRQRPDAIVASVFTLAAVYVTTLGVLGRTAWQLSRPVITAQLPPHEHLVAHTISPQPANPLAWQIVAETQAAVYRHTFSVLEQPGGTVRLPKNTQHPLVRSLRGTPEYRAWQVFARHPVAAIANNGPARKLYLMDARYPMFPSRGFSSFEIDLPTNTSPPSMARVSDRRSYNEGVPGKSPTSTRNAHHAATTYTGEAPSEAAHHAVRE